jgi:hypothetical protein
VTVQDAVLSGDLCLSKACNTMSLVISLSNIGDGLYIDVYLQSRTHVLWNDLPFSTARVIARYEKQTSL